MGMKHFIALILSSLVPGELSIFHTYTGHYVFFRQLSISFAIFPYGVYFFIFFKISILDTNLWSVMEA